MPKNGGGIFTGNYQFDDPNSVLIKKAYVGTKDTYIGVKDSSGLSLYSGISASGNAGIWSSGYYKDGQFINNGKWIVMRDSSGIPKLLGNSENITGILSINNGGTGGTTKEQARTNLGLGSAALLSKEDCYNYKGSNMVSFNKLIVKSTDKVDNLNGLHLVPRTESIGTNIEIQVNNPNIHLNKAGLYMAVIHVRISDNVQDNTTTDIYVDRKYNTETVYTTYKYVSVIDKSGSLDCISIISMSNPGDIAIRVSVLNGTSTNTTEYSYINLVQLG